MFSFFFVLMISSYFLITFAASSSCCISSASLFNYAGSTTSFMMIDSNNCFFIWCFDSRFVFLLSATHFHTYKQKNNHCSTNLKRKYFSKLIFCFQTCKMSSFSHSSFKVSSINSLVAGNLLSTASKTTKATFNFFCPF